MNIFKYDIIQAYAITFGWGLVGAVTMGLGILIVMGFLRLTLWQVKPVQLIRDGNISIAIIIASVMIALGLVISTAVHP